MYNIFSTINGILLINKNVNLKRLIKIIYISTHSIIIHFKIIINDTGGEQLNILSLLLCTEAKARRLSESVIILILWVDKTGLNYLN